ncbi:TIGR03943 family putative permease subunit [Streptomyces arenae]|uniref:TIGR03943 family putative permease subunit n=1 Tax=Streptomyces arenae TaxID=29301 RepID=UPI00265A86D3|nr:TIGR03943 family protein [Streptomyces arenae]MCG7203779.1 TIGR03943 family protein [Streptomyces arenae]
MNRQAQAAVMFLVGAALLHAGMTDLYLRYVKAGLQPLILAAGAVLIVAALATAWYEWRARTRTHATSDDAHAHEDAHDDAHAGAHGPAHPEPRISWLLVLPLLALILVAPPALGSYSAVRAGTALQQPYGYMKLPTSDPIPLNLVDYAGRAVYDHGRSFGGRSVRITGFVALDKSGAPYLVRMALNCCAADAQPVKVALTGKIPPVLQPDAWLQVTGTYTARVTHDPVNNGPIPYLTVTQAKPIPAPSDPYDESWNN